MANKGTLHLTLVTDDGTPLGESVEIRFTNQNVTDNRSVTVKVSGPIQIPDLLAFPTGLYEVEVLPQTFEIQSRFVNIAPDQVTDLCIVFHGGKHGPPPPPPCPPKVPDTLSEADLATHLQAAIASPGNAAATAIVWQDRSDEAIVHLDSLQVRMVPPAVFAAIDLESDQSGRGTLIVRFVFGGGQDPAGLFATTDEVVKGHPQLAARWGPIFRDLIWSALTRLSSDHAAERGLAPLSLNIAGGSLRLSASPSIPLPERVQQVLNPPAAVPPPARPK